ncbi:MAG TPA: DUF2310 family Zn-ribbon-containing protein [Pirellulaceae bacterium]|jgi:predicted  nucleic acid-binding Zn ribbon protein|nr:DUF2310 family Zn-ribbon-containing protein [Pirellulaceae bacterium]
MFVARVSFPVHADNRDAVGDAANDLTACWYKNGQVVDQRIDVYRGMRLDVFVRIAERTSLDHANDNVYAAECRSRIHPIVPEVEILGSEFDPSPICHCSSNSALTLFTHYLSTSPPVSCLDCFGAVPLYRLPHAKDQEHLTLLQWAADYRACDTLQMHCTTGERFAERQLYDASGSLPRNGRNLAADLERLSGIPTYYYLHKMRTRSRESDLTRPCPGCGEAWRLESPLHIFDFRCDSCRLLSACASMTS